MIYKIYSEEDFNGSFLLECKSLEQAEKEVLNLIDIHSEEEN